VADDRHPSQRSGEAVERWERNAGFWDEAMGADGNSFHLQLVRPAVERLLGDVADARVLEIACGNGLFARRLAERGAQVIATDASAQMLERARARPSQGIEYRPLDAADPAQLAALGRHAFDAVVCNMALMDMADIEPLAAALPALLREHGRFVFSITHPCFNTTGMRMVHEVEPLGDGEREQAGVLITRYTTPTVAEGVAIVGQPATQLYFERPLGQLLGTFLAAGMVLDGIEEPSFPGSTDRSALHWESLPEIPPVLCCRFRPAPG
jgi:SAM-dependent methyltransferase